MLRDDAHGAKSPESPTTIQTPSSARAPMISSTLTETASVSISPYVSLDQLLYSYLDSEASRPQLSGNPRVYLPRSKRSQASRWHNSARHHLQNPRYSISNRQTLVAMKSGTSPDMSLCYQ